jgi:hypothetical protein
MCNLHNLNINSSFGYHEYATQSSFNKQKKCQVIEKTLKIALVALASITCAFIASNCLFGTSLILPIIITSTLFLTTYIYKKTISIQVYQSICKTAGIIFRSPYHAHDYKLNHGNCNLMPTENSSETQFWREELIKIAEHNIVISGNYCGGESFIRLLDLIEKRLKEKPNLNVVIISSPKFLLKKEISALKKLTTANPDNFSIVISPDIVHLSPGVKKSTNHTKVMAVDFGRYFIQGGSGIKPNFAQTGLPGLNPSQFLNSEFTKFFPKYEHTTHRADNDELNQSNKDSKKTFWDKLLPGAFRDMDFVGSSKDEKLKQSVGFEHYRQALLLAYRWEDYDNRLKGKLTQDITAEELGIFTGISENINVEDSLVLKMLKQGMPDELENTSLGVLPLLDNCTKLDKAEMKVFSQGPMHSISEFTNVTIAAIRASKENIVINHMYFHPSSEIFDEIVKAMKRGVKVKIISNALDAGSPYSHKFFVPRSRFNYKSIYQALSDDLKGNLEVYEFNPKKLGNHKKVMIFDGEHVIAGSSNMGLKSTKWVCDDEMNFLATSKKLALETLRICDVDTQHSKKMEDFSISFKLITEAFYQRLWAPLID